MCVCGGGGGGGGVDPKINISHKREWSSGRVCTFVCGTQTNH